MEPFLFDLDKFSFNSQNIELLDSNHYASELFPVLYIIFDEKKKIAYVGESTNIKNRLKNHLKHDEKKKLTHFYLISSGYLNKSATLDLESLFIQYIPPAFNYKLLNGNLGVMNHNYYQKDDYKRMFSKIWEIFRLEGEVTKSLLDIENTDLFKYSPYKSLTLSQYEAIKDVIRTLLGKNNTVFIKGVAGTGKTIVGITLMKLLSAYHLYEVEDIIKDDEEFSSLLIELKSKFPEGLTIAMVVPMTSLRSTLKDVFSKITGLKKNMIIGPSEVRKKDYDLLIVDESHRLQRRVSITNYKSHDDMNKRLGLSKEGTHLDWIMKCSRKRVFFYDSEQSIKPADVRSKDFQKVKDKKDTIEIELESQMRCVGGNGFIQFVDHLLNCNNPFPYISEQYDLKLFDNMKDLIDSLAEKEKKHQLCRLMSGYSWEWQTKDPSNAKYDIEIDGVKLTWNRKSEAWINSTTDMTEMGCIHTVQGYDLNYAGIIFGEEIDYDPSTNSIVIDKNKYFDAKGKSALKSDEELKEYIIKIYKTMMYRGIKGAYIYVCNKNLRNYFGKYF